MIAEKINALEAQRQQHAAERDAILARAATWQRAQERIGDVQAWCRATAASLATLTYEQKQLALDALGVQVKVWRTDHEPRYKISASIPLEGAIVDSSSRTPCPGRV